MQTFLPEPDFCSSVKCLDFRRLGKQRVEARQILNALIKEKYGWKNHPAVKMWKGYEKALIEYGNCCIREWIVRGYKNNMEIMLIGEGIIFPHWLGDKRLHDSHKSNLLRKDYKWYSQFNWDVKDNLDYWWPV